MPNRIIPTTSNPWRCVINNVAYSYTAGTTQNVPSEVASLIDALDKLVPQEAPMPGIVGQVWTRIQGGEGWVDRYKAPTRDAYGGLKMGASVSDAAGEAPTAAEFNALLAQLRKAGVIDTKCKMDFFTQSPPRIGTVSATAGGEAINRFDFVDSGETVVFTATAKDGYEFIGWHIYANGSVGAKVSDDAAFSFTASKDVSYCAIFQAASNDEAQQ